MADRLPSRRDVLSLGIGAFVVAATPGLLRGRASVTRRTVPLMGTLAEIAVVHRDGRWAQGAIDAALRELQRVHRSMTRFSPHSDVGRANLRAAESPVRVGADTAAVLASSLRWAGATHGAFDPALGGAVGLWDIGRRRMPPEEAEIRRWAGRSLFRRVEVGREGGVDVVVFTEPDVGLDLGGIAKGWGVDRAVDALRGWGIRDALVNVGGDLYALGVSPEGDPWQIGVRSSDDPATLSTRLRVSDRAVATSGDYERYFDHQGRRYHHLLDPVTGEPRRARTHSVTVTADSCMDADAAGTAAFGLERHDAERLLGAVRREVEILHMG